MTIIYQEHDASLQDLAGKTVAVIGYGNLGRAVTLNLNDSGIHVIVSGNEEECAAAAGDGLPTTDIANAVRDAAIIMLLVPDESMTTLYMAHISPNLKRGDTLIFSSAYNFAFGYIEAPPFVDVGLIAPRTISGDLRPGYLAGQGFPSFVAVGQDASGKTWTTVLGVALASGLLRAGAVEVNIEQEAELSLFIQQAILPAFHNMMLTAAQLLLKQGYTPEAVLTDLYLSGKFTDYIQQVAQKGMMNALELTTSTGQYGTLSRLSRFNESKLERLMEITLEEIRTKDFAQEWEQEYADGHPRLNRLRKQESAHDIWELEQQTLDLLGR